jgi:hypothetical protein
MLQDIQRFVVDQSALARTERALRDAGEEGCEMFVLWTGRIEQRILRVTTVHVPEQQAYRTRDGLLVRVEGEALHRLNAWLYDHKETLAAQVHAHPTQAFHSATDDTYPIVTTLGGLSVVAPDFARHGVLTRGTAVFRLTGRGWTRVRRRRLKRLLEVTD